MASKSRGTERISEALLRSRMRLLHTIRDAAVASYGGRLVSLAVFGSYARGTYGHGSDIDLLAVVDQLPARRWDRWAEWDAVEAEIPKRYGAVPLPLAPIVTSPEAIAAGPLILLDLTEDAILLHDPTGFLARRLERLRNRLHELGARRVWLDGDRWYWDLKPDYRPGEVFEL
jgi:predicted nucleotidyltransferase